MVENFSLSNITDNNTNNSNYNAKLSSNGDSTINKNENCFPKISLKVSLTSDYLTNGKLDHISTNNLKRDTEKNATELQSKNEALSSMLTQLFQSITSSSHCNSNQEIKVTHDNCKNCDKRNSNDDINTDANNNNDYVTNNVIGFHNGVNSTSDTLLKNYYLDSLNVARNASFNNNHCQSQLTNNHNITSNMTNQELYATLLSSVGLLTSANNDANSNMNGVEDINNSNLSSDLRFALNEYANNNNFYLSQDLLIANGLDEQTIGMIANDGMADDLQHPDLNSVGGTNNNLSCFAKKKGGTNMTECVPVPSSEHVAEIVGRQGCKIKALRAKTNTYIKTPVRGEEPVFVVTGRKEDVTIAKREIILAAEHFSAIRASRKNSAPPFLLDSVSAGTFFTPNPNANNDGSILGVPDEIDRTTNNLFMLNNKNNNNASINTHNPNSSMLCLQQVQPQGSVSQTLSSHLLVHNSATELSDSAVMETSNAGHTSTTSNNLLPNSQVIGNGFPVDVNFASTANSNGVVSNGALLGDQACSLMAPNGNGINNCNGNGNNNDFNTQITIRVRVPYKVVGLVVGPKGATIKRIQQNTHTYIVTPSRDREPVFEITGNPANVHSARIQIENHIAVRTSMSGGILASTTASQGVIHIPAPANLNGGLVGAGSINLHPNGFNQGGPRGISYQNLLDMIQQYCGQTNNPNQQISSLLSLLVGCLGNKQTPNHKPTGETLHALMGLLTKLNYGTNGNSVGQEYLRQSLNAGNHFNTNNTYGSNYPLHQQTSLQDGYGPSINNMKQMRSLSLTASGNYNQMNADCQASNQIQQRLKELLARRFSLMSNINGTSSSANDAEKLNLLTLNENSTVLSANNNGSISSHFGVNSDIETLLNGMNNNLNDFCEKSHDEKHYQDLLIAKLNQFLAARSPTVTNSTISMEEKPNVHINSSVSTNSPLSDIAVNQPNETLNVTIAHNINKGNQHGKSSSFNNESSILESQPPNDVLKFLEDESDGNNIMNYKSDNQTISGGSVGHQAFYHEYVNYNNGNNNNHQYMVNNYLNENTSLASLGFWSNSPSRPDKNENVAARDKRYNSDSIVRSAFLSSDDHGNNYNDNAVTGNVNMANDESTLSYQMAQLKLFQKLHGIIPEVPTSTPSSPSALSSEECKSNQGNYEMSENSNTNRQDSSKESEIPRNHMFVKTTTDSFYHQLASGNVPLNPPDWNNPYNLVTQFNAQSQQKLDSLKIDSNGIFSSGISSGQPESCQKKFEDQYYNNNTIRFSKNSYKSSA